MSQDKQVCHRCGHVAASFTETVCPEDGSPLVPEEEHRRSPLDPLLGTVVFGRYPVIGYFGSQAGTSDYRVREPETGEALRLRVIPPGLRPPSEETRQRFLAAAAQVAELRHPGIVPLVASGVTPDGTGLLLFRQVVGTPLAELRQERLSRAEVLELGHLLLAALDHALERGVVHPALRPRAVWVSRPASRPGTPSLTVQVLDFDLPQLLLPQDPLAEPGFGAATDPRRYQAPELTGGRLPDVRSLVFAVCAILHEALTGDGHDPWSASADLLPGGLFGPAGPFSGRPGGEVLDPLVALLRTGLAADPGARPATLRELQHALAALPSPPPGTPAPASRGAASPPPPAAARAATLPQSLLPQALRQGTTPASGAPAVTPLDLQSPGDLVEESAGEVFDLVEEAPAAAPLDEQVLRQAAQARRYPGSLPVGEELRLCTDAERAGPGLAGRREPTAPWPGAAGRRLASAARTPAAADRPASSRRPARVSAPAPTAAPSRRPLILGLGCGSLLLLGGVLLVSVFSMHRPAAPPVASPDDAPPSAAGPGDSSRAAAARAQQQAEELSRRGSTAEAIAALRQALALDPERAPARALLAQLLLAQGDAAGTEAELSQASARSPLTPPELLLLASAQQRQGKAEEALRSLLALQQALGAAPQAAVELPDLPLVSARILLDNGGAEQASAALARLLTPAETRREPWLLAGEAELQLGRPDRALGHYQLLIARDPRDVDALYGLARVHLRRDDRAAATRVLQQLVQLDGEGRHPEALKLLGYLLRDAGKKTEARRLLQTYLTRVGPKAKDIQEVQLEIRALEGKAEPFYMIR
ncbi:MAG: tetratricopeptide repeat protein [Myxococcota bacterium]|jgi:serine/threonine-protein kinase|nr:tetratricopeptide repeat protein [Myxococcota bacterium]